MKQTEISRGGGWKDLKVLGSAFNNSMRLHVYKYLIEKLGTDGVFKRFNMCRKVLSALFLINWLMFFWVLYDKWFTSSFAASRFCWIDLSLTATISQIPFVRIVVWIFFLDSLWQVCCIRRLMLCKCKNSPIFWNPSFGFHVSLQQVLWLVIIKWLLKIKENFLKKQTKLPSFKVSDNLHKSLFDLEVII